MAYVVVTLVVIILLLLSKRRSAPPQHGGEINPPVSHKAGSVIRVGAYNIHRARGTDRVKSINRIANVLKGCDIAGLSELEGGTPLFRQNQLDRLAKHLNMAGIFACTQRRWGLQNRGNGAISRFKINNWSTAPLEDTVGNHPRCLLHLNVDVDGEQLDVLVTHLARRVDQETQLKAVLDRFNQFEKALLIGDLNMDQHHPSLEQALLDPTITDAHAKHVNATNVSKHNKIDWILARGLSVVDAGIIESVASDHPFYWADVKISTTETAV